MKKLIYKIRFDLGFLYPYVVYNFLEGTTMVDDFPEHVEHIEFFKTEQEAKDFILIEKLAA